MGLTRSEKETILRIDEENREWIAYTSSSIYMRKFEESGWKCTKVYKSKSGRIIAKEFVAPPKQISIRKIKGKRIYTEEQLFNLRERARNMRLIRMQKNKKED